MDHAARSRRRLGRLRPLMTGGGSWPLTGAQQGVWLAQALAPADPIYNTADAVELTGAVDEAALAAQIRHVLDGAEALHVVFVEGPSGPRQLTREDRDWPLPVLDLRGEADPRAAAEHFMQTDLRTPVDLARDRLFATALLRTGETAWTWYLRIHHIATDAYATALLMRRVAERSVAGTDPKAPLNLAGIDALVAA
ncbi:MAG: condensation domain-containing protein, partial [Solirubrobacteraceae bacterium]|nr:condensation domain-containing protein [Solirubrobacteraceae bacterium]